jgi:phosphate transport system substrate-binding protein
VSRGIQLKLSTKTRAIPLTMALAGSLALTACGASNESSSSGASGSAGGSAQQLSGTLNGAGSSAQQAAMQGWTAGFNTQQPNVTVNYDPVGSGGGRTQFIAGGIDFAGSDAALNSDELPKAQQRCGSAGTFELPDYISAIAVAFNLPGVKSLNLAPDTIAKIFTGAVSTWNDPAIAADNPGVTLPSTKITPVHRSDNSGTTSNFTDYLSKAAPTVWTSKPSGDWPIQSGEAGAQTAGMLSSLKAGEGTIGYIDESQVGQLGVASVKVGSGYAKPTADAAAAAVENSPVASGGGQYDFALSLNRTPSDPSQYPIVLVSYHIGCVQNAADKADLLKGFLSYVISADGQEAAAKQAGSAPISDKIRQQNQTAVDAITSK